MNSLDGSGSRSPGRFHTLGKVARLLSSPYPCAGSFGRIDAANHSSQELPRPGLREGPQLGATGFSSTSHGVFRASTSPMGSGIPQW